MFQNYLSKDHTKVRYSKLFLFNCVDPIYYMKVVDPDSNRL